MLKALCGLVASGQATRNNGQRLSDVVPETWVRWLFGEAEILPPLGLHVSGQIGHNEPIDASVAIGPISTQDGTVVGLEFSFHWLRATLILVHWQGSAEGVVNLSSVRRPRYIALHQEGAVHQVDLRWSHSPGAGVEMTHMPTPV
jgi:hypothetical protein